MSLRALPAFAFAAALALVGSTAAHAQSDADAAFHATTLSISAAGEVKAEPDQATITLGVQTTQPTAAQAMADNATRMSQVVAALRRQGLAGKDIQTSGINLSAQYDYQPNVAPRLVGYQASNQVTVTVGELARLGPTLDAVTAAGANEIQGVGFGIKDPQGPEDEARLKAVKALQAKAELYARASGYRIGRLVNLSEGGGAAPLPMAKVMSFARAAAAAPTPVEPGQLTVRIEVSGLYELVR